MATSNLKLFDENKANLLTDTEYSTNTQRLNGVQSGVASSKLNNKAMYQVSLVAYAIGQLMAANGKDANDANAVSTFVANMDDTLLQKVKDIASSEEAIAGVNNSHFMTPYTTKAAIDNFYNTTIKEEIEKTFKIGDIKESVRNDFDDNWIPCDGTKVNKTLYPELYNLLQVSYNGLNKKNILIPSGQYQGGISNTSVSAIEFNGYKVIVCLSDNDSLLSIIYSDNDFKTQTIKTIKYTTTVSVTLIYLAANENYISILAYRPDVSNSNSIYEMRIYKDWSNTDFVSVMSGKGNIGYGASYEYIDGNFVCYFHTQGEQKLCCLIVKQTASQSITSNIDDLDLDSGTVYPSKTKKYNNAYYVACRMADAIKIYKTTNFTTFTLQATTTIKEYYVINAYDKYFVSYPYGQVTSNNPVYKIDLTSGDTDIIYSEQNSYIGNLFYYEGTYYYCYPVKNVTNPLRAFKEYAAHDFVVEEDFFYFSSNYYPYRFNIGDFSFMVEFYCASNTRNDCTVPYIGINFDKILPKIPAQTSNYQGWIKAKDNNT